MAIPATRFTFLDKDTNLATSDFFKAGNLGTLNAVIQDVTKITSQLKNLVGNNGKNAISAALNLASNSPGLQRLAKDGFSSVMDVTGLNSTGVTSFCQEALSSVKEIQGTVSSTVSAITNLSTAAQQTVLGAVNSVSGLANTVGLNGITTKINSINSDITGMSNVINKVTNGNYTTTFGNNITLSNLITGICTQGYSGGLPNVFSSISNSINNNGVMLSSGNVLIKNFSKTGNTAGMMDIIDSSIGNSLKSVNSNITQLVTKGFSIPTTSSKEDNISLGSSFINSMTSLDDKWNKSNNITDVPGIANLDKTNTDLINAITYVGKKDTISKITSLDTVPSLSTNAVNSLLLKSKNVINNRSQLFGVPVLN